jgi:RsiW-degrading membrane proteinase PrsW (M82 family)
MNLIHNGTFQFEMASLIPKTKNHFRFFYLLTKEVTITMTTLMSEIIEELQ